MRVRIKRKKDKLNVKQNDDQVEELKENESFQKTLWETSLDDIKC